MIALTSTTVILFLILFSSTVSAALLTITETRITTNDSAQLYPSIYGDRIVWQDARNGVWNESGNIDNLDIYMYNISTSKETQITTNKSNQSFPAIYKDRVVWVDDRNGNPDIYMYDLSTSKETRITTSGSANCCRSPAIYGDRIVWTDMRWTDMRNGNEDIYMYDISTSKETQITTNEFDQCDPSIYGDRIVWFDFRDGYNEGQSCIFMYNISTSKETQVSKFGYRYIDPAIYGDKIVYEDNEISDMCIYDLSTHKETRIPSNGVIGRSSPAIYEDRIVYWYHDSEAPSVFRDIYMYNLSTSREIQITTNESDKVSPAIYGDRIVWIDTRNGYPNDDIYMATLSESEQTSEPPVANFSAAPLTGKAPLKVKFTSTSTGSPTEWKWNFGDGSDIIDGTTSTYQNPEHTYSTAGIYTVKHTAINAYGRDTEVNTNYITVKAAPVKPVASFVASPTSGNAPLKVQFKDESKSNPSSWKWSFGDGTYSTAQNPAHTYSRAGKYTISLTVKNDAGSSAVTKSSYIIVNVLKAPVAAFTASATSGKAPLKVQFTDRSTNSPTSWKWNVGDGTYSTSKNPSHPYSKKGRYTVYLTAKNSAGSNTKLMSGYITVK